MACPGRILTLAAVPLVILAACYSTSPPSSPEVDAAGPAPAVEATPEFGAVPLAGWLRFVPAAETSGWRWRVDPITTEPRAWEGVIDGPDSIPFRFEVPGIHTIRVELEGPAGPVVVEKRVIVTDPETDFEILAQRSIAGIVTNPEGIAIDPGGRWLYVGGYVGGQVARLDAETLEPLDVAMFHFNVEGLSVTPSGDRLVAIHSHSSGRVSVIRLPELELEGEIRPLKGFFAQALDDGRALVSGAAFAMVDLERREPIAELGGFNYWHFAVEPAGQRVAVVEGGTIQIRSLPSLSLMRTIEGLYASQLAFDPHEDKLYTIEGDRFRVFDPATGASLASVDLGLGCGYCSANPVATFAGGRYVAFERSGAVDIVDTGLDLPRFRFDSPGSARGPAGVAALPDSDVFYVLGGPAMAVYKLRVRD